jgi:hypothetical protein
MGILGVIAFLSFYVLAFKRCFRSLFSNDRELRYRGKILILALMVLAVNVQFEDPHFTQPYIIYFWIFMGEIFTGVGYPKLTARLKAVSFEPVVPRTVMAK